MGASPFLVDTVQALRDEGLIRQLGLTNFDVQRTRELLDAGVDIVSNQVRVCMCVCREAGMELCSRRLHHWEYNIDI
jgi:diketogulonate reductase-like aldo/keto reductase